MNQLAVEVLEKEPFLVHKKKMNILLMENFPNIDPLLLTSYIDPTHTIIEYGQEHEPETIDALLIRGRKLIDASFLDTYCNIRFIFRVGVGLDNVDLEECKRRGIEVINRPGSNSASVAEMAVRGTLSLLRKGLLAHETSKVGDAIPERYLFLGTEVTSLTLGFLGGGNIAQEIMKRMAGFEPREIVVYDPYITTIGYGATVVGSMQEIWEKSDILFAAVPLLPETRNLLCYETLTLCKPNVKIVNVSRGGIVHEADLYDFLVSHPEAGAYLDVRNDEPHKTDLLQALLSLKNVIFTPHIGAETVEAQKRMHYFETLAAR